MLKAVGVAAAGLACLLSGALHADDQLPAGRIKGPSAAIVRGAPDLGHAAVGVLTYEGGDGLLHLCTATLIDPYAVLTAGHCVADARDGTLLFFPNGGSRMIAARRTATAIFANPGPASFCDPTWDDDIAVAILSSPVTDIPLIALPDGNPTVGTAIELVGFGATMLGGTDLGIKRTARNAIQSFCDAATSASFLVGRPAPDGQPCFGDSGGPALSVRGSAGEQVILGVHSRGDCDALGQETSVYPHLAYILAAIAEARGGQPTQPFCSGDCDGNGRVTIDALITLIDIVVGSKPVSFCLAGDANQDGAVTVDEVVRAVGHALGGCPAP